MNFKSHSVNIDLNMEEVDQEIDSLAKTEPKNKLTKTDIDSL